MKKIILSVMIFFLLVVTPSLSKGLTEHNIGSYFIKKTANTKNSFVKQSSVIGQDKINILKEGCCKGYTLLNLIEVNGLNAYAQLIDMNGTEIRRWLVDPAPAKVLPGGSIIGGEGVLSRIKHFEASNLTQMDWYGNIVWRFNNWDDGGTGVMMARQHHDFQREGNPVGYYAPGQQFIDEGKTLVLAHIDKNVPNISKTKLLDDVIYEVYWNGSLTGFEWYASDHFEEMGFNWYAKHGIKYFPGFKWFSIGDWLHINSMSLLGKNQWYTEDPINYSYFHPENIIIESRHANFIAIISRETGDIVWRVGPDFSKNTLEGRKLGQIIGPHHVHMVPDGLPGEGNILIFDNGGWAGYGYFGLPNRFRFYSRVIEFNPVTFDIVWEYSYNLGRPWIPIFGGDHRFFSLFIGSAQRLPNGNTLICEGVPGRIIEVTPEKNIVWEYLTSWVYAAMPVYRAYRIPPDWIPGNPAGYPLWDENN